MGLQQHERKCYAMIFCMIVSWKKNSPENIHAHSLTAPIHRKKRPSPKTFSIFFSFLCSKQKNHQHTHTPLLVPSFTILS